MLYPTSCQLCWLVSFLLPSIHSQYTSAAIVGKHQVANSNEVLHVKEATIAIWRGVSAIRIVRGFQLITNWQAYTPDAEHSWTTPLAEPQPATEYYPVTSTSAQAVHILESSAVPIYVPETTSSATSSSTPPGSTQSAVTTSSNPSTTGTTLAPTLTTLSTTATVTVATTVLVSISTTATPASIQPSPTSDAASEAIQSSAPSSPRPMAQVGLGLGIAFLVLSVVAIAGLYVWYRRRRSSSSNSDDIKDTKAMPLTRLFAFTPLAWRRTKNTKDDAEWSIESVEKVSIVRNVRAQSVLTVSRSNSRRSDGPSESGSYGRGARVALSSHPMTPSYTAVLKKGPGGKDNLEATGWPLSMERM